MAIGRSSTHCCALERCWARGTFGDLFGTEQALGFRLSEDMRRPAEGICPGDCGGVVGDAGSPCRVVWRSKRGSRGSS